MAMFRRVELLIGQKEQGQVGNWGLITSDMIETALTEMAEKHEMVYIAIYDQKKVFAEVRSPYIDSQIRYTMKEEG